MVPEKYVDAHFWIMGQTHPLYCSLLLKLFVLKASLRISLQTLAGRSDNPVNEVSFVIQSVDSQTTIQVHRAWTINSLPDIRRDIPTDQERVGASQNRMLPSNRRCHCIRFTGL